MTAALFARRLGLIGLLGLSSLLSCTGKTSVAGTATDAENTVAGVIKDSLSKAVMGVQVSLVSDSLGWNSTVALAKSSVVILDSLHANRVAYTDSKGQFEFAHVDSGLVFSLSFTAQDSTGTHWVQLIKSVTLDSANHMGKLVHLVKASALTGQLVYNRSDNPLYQFSDQFRIGIAGSGKTIPVVAGHGFVLGDVPPGPQNLLIYPSDQYLLQSLLNAGVPLDSLVMSTTFDFSSGDTIQAGNLVWKIPASFAWLFPDSLVFKRNMMHGTTVAPNGSPLAKVQVRVILDSLGYSYSIDGAVDSFTITDTTVTFSDSTGHWSLPVPSATHFNVEYLQRDSADSLLFYGVHASLSSKLDTSKTIVDTLRVPAVLSGEVIYTEEPGAWIQIGSHFKVGIQGTSRYMNVMAGQKFELRGLPAGRQTLLFYPGDSFLWQTFADTLGSQNAMIDSVQFVVFTSGVALGLQAVTYTLPAKP